MLVSHDQIRDASVTHLCIEHIVITYAFSAGHCAWLGIKPQGKEVISASQSSWSRMCVSVESFMGFHTS